MNFTTKIPLIFILSIFSCKTCSYMQPGTTTQFHIQLNNTRSVSILSVPPKITTATPAPLLIALHGYGSNAAAFHDLWKPATDSLNIILLTPQGETNIGSPLNWAWGENTDNIIFSALDIARKHVLINPKKIFITGFSAGGAYCYSIGLHNPHIFKGIAPIGARFEENLLPEDISKILSMNIYIGHGELDNNLDKAQKAFHILSQHAPNTKLNIYKNTGHTLPEPMVQELLNISMFLSRKTE